MAAVGLHRFVVMQFLKNMDYMSWNEVSIQFIKRRMLQLPKICFH